MMHQDTVGSFVPTDNRFEIEFLEKKTGQTCILSSAHVVRSRQQIHLVGYDRKLRRSLGAGTVILRTTVLLPLRCPVAS